MTFEDAPEDPVALFETWFREAGGRVEQPETMALATVDGTGRPAVRYVLLKGVEDGSFHFYTNYESPKARQLDGQPFASLAFYWHALERQIRIEGAAERLDAETSDAYFATRPRGSQLGAWASLQSRERPPGALEERLARITAQYEGQTVPRPPHWGGYRLVPSVIEFWQGQPSRLHDRLRYERDGQGWTQTGLYP